MAVLTNADRVLVWRDYMVSASETRDTLALTKTELRAAVDAVDAWVDANASAFNTAIPLPARTALTARQKAQLLMYVVERRFAVS